MIFDVDFQSFNFENKIKTLYIDVWFFFCFFLSIYPMVSMKFKLLSTPFSICMIVLSPICSCTWDLLICPDWLSHLVLMQIAIIFICHLQVCLIIILRHHVNLSSVICYSCSVSRISHHIHTPPTIVYCIYIWRPISGQYDTFHHVFMPPNIRSICCPSSW